MAKLTKNEEYIVEQYVRYFGKAPSKAEIAKYNDFKTPKEILTEIIGDADDSKATLTTKEFVNNAFQNLFGRDATTKEMNKYSKVVDKGEDLPINAIVKAAKKSDKAVYEAKKAVALFIAEKGSTTNIDLDKITKDNYTDVYNLKTKKLLVDSVEDLVTKIDAMKDNGTGQTFILTASADTGAAFVGTEKGDVFKADSFVSAAGNYLPTLNSSDELDGRAGKDTLNITSDNTAAYTMASATIKNIETITIKGADDVTADVSGSNITGLETISVLKSKKATVTATATTDVNVSGATGVIKVDGGKNVVVNDATADQDITIGATTGAAGTITVTDTKQGIGAIDIDGGTDVTVTATAADISTGATSITGAIKVGQGATAILPTGDIKVTQNLEFDGNDAGAAANTADLTGGAITISGGKTVDVTVNANNVAKVAAAGDAIKVGTITVKGGDNTTTVTVTQNDNAQTFTSAKVAEVKQSTTITFKDVTAGETVTLASGSTLTFTASKDLTAAEVAAAFANLSEGDLQVSGGKVANGVFTGKFSTAWTSASANGAAVVFTAISNAETDITIGGTAALTATQVKVNGTVASGGVESSNATVFGAVTITDSGDNKITTVTVDGYAANSAVVSDALTTLTLKNSAGLMNVDVDAANTFTLNVDNVNHAVSLDAVSGADIKTLTINATGEEESAFGLVAAAVETLTIAAAADLDINNAQTNLAALKTVTITGAGDVNLGDISSATALNSFNASANTGGVTAKIETEIDAAALTGTITEYVFSAGNDVVTLSNDVIETKITLGAGDDKITLASGTGIADVVATIDGGTGSNTIDMTAADAQILSSNDTFEGKISNFQKLSLDQVATGTASTINLANMDDISYVISANTYGSNTNQTEYSDVTFQNLLVGQSVTVDGLTLTNTTDATITAANVALAFQSKTVAGGTPVSVADETWSGSLTGFNSGTVLPSGAVRFTSTALNQNVVPDITVNNAGVAAVADVVASNPVEGDGLGTAEAFDIVVANGLSVGQSYTLLGITITAQKTLTATEVATAFAALDGALASSTGNYTASGSLSTPTNWGTPAVTSSGATITITNATNANIVSTASQFTLVGNTTVAAPTVNVATTDGFSSTTNGSLTINSMANNGTLELTDAGAGVTVIMKDASGKTDTFKIVTGDEAGNVGVVVVNGVETINVTTTDIFTDDGVKGGGTKNDGKDDSNSSSTLVVSADAAKTVNVFGAGDLTLDTTSVVLTKVDASKMTGDLDYRADGAAAGTEVIAGSGDDTLRADGEKDVLKGNAGNDTFNAYDLTKVYGGADADTFNFYASTSLAKVSTIMDSLTSGDTFNLFDDANADTAVNKFYAEGAQYNATVANSVALRVDASIQQTAEGEATWFQFGNNTYIVIDGTNSNDTVYADVYEAGRDTVIEITGLVDLSKASFNATTGTLEIA